MRVVGRWVAVKREEKKQTTSGIQLLESEVKHIGTVIGVGSDVTATTIGEEVAFTPFAYFEHEIDGEKILFLDERDIQARL
jgi:co-chaperonin GroES (HSP10)